MDWLYQVISRESTLNPFGHCRSDLQPTKSLPINFRFIAPGLVSRREPELEINRHHGVDYKNYPPLLPSHLPSNHHQHCNTNQNPIRNLPPNHISNNNNNNSSTTHHSMRQCHPHAPILDNRRPRARKNNGPAEGAQLDRPVLVEGGAAVRGDRRGHDGLFPGGKGETGSGADCGDE